MSILVVEVLYLNENTMFVNTQQFGRIFQHISTSTVV
jgi:hypothetical protein